MEKIEKRSDFLYRIQRNLSRANDYVMLLTFFTTFVGLFLFIYLIVYTLFLAANDTANVAGFVYFENFAQSFIVDNMNTADFHFGVFRMSLAIYLLAMLMILIVYNCRYVLGHSKRGLRYTFGVSTCGVLACAFVIFSAVSNLFDAYSSSDRLLLYFAYAIPVFAFCLFSNIVNFLSLKVYMHHYKVCVVPLRKKMSKAKKQIAYI